MLVLNEYLSIEISLLDAFLKREITYTRLLYSSFGGIIDTINYLMEFI